MFSFDEMEIVALFLSIAAGRKVDKMIENVKGLDKVTKMLQQLDTSIRSAHVYCTIVFKY